MIKLAALLLFSFVQPQFIPDPPHQCDDCATWNKPRDPFRVFGNTYYVGSDGLSALLITGDAGHILLDGGLSQTAPLIHANIRTLGFKTEDIKLIAVSHGHFDHGGGVASLQRFTGATVAASPATAAALRRGENTPDDPQFGFGRAFNGFPVVKTVREVRRRSDAHRHARRNRASHSRTFAREFGLYVAIVSAYAAGGRYGAVSP